MDRKELIEVLEVIYEVDMTWRNIKNTVMGTAAAAASVFLGGIAAGPPGFLFGTLVSLAVYMNHKKKMVSVTKKLSKEQKEKLRKRLQKLLEDINEKDMKKMADYLLQHPDLHERFMDIVLSFLKQEKDFEYAREENGWNLVDELQRDPLPVIYKPGNKIHTKQPVQIVYKEAMQPRVNAIKQPQPQYVPFKYISAPAQFVEKEKVRERARALVR